MTDRLTVIADLHADPLRLDASLAAAGRDPLLFLGDFIDAGAVARAVDDAAVLARVRALIDAGRARAVMGNHELNAILYHHTGPAGPLRAHDAKNTRQHASFLRQFPFGSEGARHWVDWFLTLPLWHEGPGLRAVHACWDEPARAVIAARCPDGRLTRDLLPEVADRATPLGAAVERLTSGVEVALPPGKRFRDASGHLRDRMRVAWWAEGLSDWRGAALSVPDASELPDGPLALDLAPYPAEAPPVLCGHYKMQGPPGIASPRAASIDYPATPVVYRWRGEGALQDDHLHPVAWPDAPAGAAPAGAVDNA